MPRTRNKSRRRITENWLVQAIVVNQIAAAMTAIRIAAHTTGVTFFELPLRGDWFAAWLNSRSIGKPAEF